MAPRRRFEQTNSLKGRLAAFISAMRERADLAVSDVEREEILKKVTQAEIASRLEAWANSPGLQPPEGLRPPNLEGGPAAKRAPRIR